jgi:hypothetical protein
MKKREKYFKKLSAKIIRRKLEVRPYKIFITSSSNFASTSHNADKNLAVVETFTFLGI